MWHPLRAKTNPLDQAETLRVLPELPAGGFGVRVTGEARRHC